MLSLRVLASEWPHARQDAAAAARGAVGVPVCQGVRCARVSGVTSPAAAPAAVGAGPRSWLPLWVGLALVWGSSFPLIMVGLETFTPIQLAGLRIASGAAAILAILLAQGRRLPGGRAFWLHAAIVGVLSAAVPFTLFAWAETRITSVLAGLFNAGTPLFTALAGVLIARGQRITPNQRLGLLIGMVGVGVILGAWQGLSGNLPGALAAIGATCCYGLAIQWQQRFLTPIAPSGEAAVAALLLCAAAASGIVVLLAGQPLAGPVRAGPLIATVILGVVGTGIAYAIFYRVLREAGALPASTVTYATPVVSTLLGVLLLGEPLTWNQPVGAAIVLLGVALVQGLIRPIPAKST